MREIVEEIVEGTGYTIEKLKGPSRERKLSAMRQRAIDELYQAGHNPTEIGKWFNRTPSAVTYARNQQSSDE